MAEMKDKVKSGIDTAAERAKEMTERADRAAQGTKEEAGGVVTAVTEKARDAAQSAAERAGQAKDKVQEWTADAAAGLGRAGESVQEWAGDAYDKTGDAMKGAGQELTALIRRYPIPALLVGLGIGYLLSRTLRT